MAKKANTPTSEEVEQVIDQTTEETTEQITEVAVESSVEINVPKPEPVQIGHPSRDFGYVATTYEVVTEEPSTLAEDGQQEEPQV
jgi:hypothetical protein